jgi:SAM-dependent methyltransferase
MDLVEHRDSSGLRHPWETARLKLVERAIRSLPGFAPGFRALDVGAGDGFAIRELAERLGFDLAVAQDANYTDEWLARLHGGPVRFVRHLEDTGDQAYDLALFLDVIEHVEDDVKLLADGTRQLRSGGFVLVTVPAFQRLFSKHDELLRHYRRYSKPELLRAVERAGLRPLDAGYFFLSLLGPRLVSVARERLLGAPAGDTLGDWGGGPRVTDLITRALDLDARVCRTLGAIGLTLPGLSAWTLCQKP